MEDSSRNGVIWSVVRVAVPLVQWASSCRKFFGSMNRPRKMVSRCWWIGWVSMVIAPFAGIILWGGAGVQGVVISWHVNQVWF